MKRKKRFNRGLRSAVVLDHNEDRDLRADRLKWLGHEDRGETVEGC